MNFRDDNRPLIAFDWSSIGLDCTSDGVYSFRVRTVEELALRLTLPHRLVCEASFESFIPARRRAMVQLLRDAGHELYVFRPTATGRFRKVNKIDKSNSNDALVIYRIATETRTHIYPLLDPNPEWTERRETINRRYLEIRAAQQKAELLINPTKEILGKFSKLSNEDKVMYGNSKLDGYCETLLAAVYYATSVTTSRGEFERVLGLWQSAHPSLLRSDMHHHAFRSQRRRGVTIADFRRTARRLRARLMEAGVGSTSIADRVEVPMEPQKGEDVVKEIQSQPYNSEWGTMVWDVDVWDGERDTTQETSD